MRMYLVVLSCSCLLFHHDCRSSNYINLLDHIEEVLSNVDMEFIVLDLLNMVMGDVNCFVFVLDDYYQEMVGNIFNDTRKWNPYFKILVNESEDLLSPNYETVKVIQQAKKNNCNLYLIFLTNGEQVARFLVFGDRHRTVDSRAKFILLKDHRLFSQKYNVLWKKLINVIFIKRHRKNNHYELSTVPFPPPINGPIIPFRINAWNYTFQKNQNLFKDKTSNLQGQSLKVVTFDHMPTTAVVLPSNYSQEPENMKPRYIGLEIEVLKTLAATMNFHYTIYEPPNANEEQWGRLQTNGSFSGLLGEMCSGKADIALGNLYYTPYHLQMVDLSVPYNTECLTFLTPESLTDNSWQTLILPFQGSMWVAVIITLFLGGFFFYVFALYHHTIETKDFTSVTPSSSSTEIETIHSNKLIAAIQQRYRPFRRYCREKWKRMNRKKHFFKKHNARYAYIRRHLWQRNFQRSLSFLLSSQEEKEHQSQGLYIFRKLNNSILYTFGMFMNVSLPRVPNVWSIKMFVGWWWLYCILVAVSYKASMTAILANPAPRVTINTLEQLAESAIGCGGWGEQSKEFFVTSLDVASQKVGRKFEIIYNVDSAVERVASGEFAYYEDVYYLHYLTVKHKDVNVLSRYNETDDKNLDKTKGKVLHIMENCVINMPISVGLQKNSPLKPRIDSYLTRVVEAGLVGKWLNDVMFKIRTTEAERQNEALKALMNLSKLYGAIAVLLGGYVISILTLLVELIIWYGYEKRRPDFDKYNLSLYYAKKRESRCC